MNFVIRTFFLCIFLKNISLTLLNVIKCSVDSPVVPKYFLIEKCHRSKLGIIAREYYTSLVSCQRLGIEKKALALNFSPPELNVTSIEYTCEVLKCAEAEGGLSLSNDTNYDYYSIYGRPLPTINSTCVPETGMFNLSPARVNYTEAQAVCKNQSGVLADVTSEQRTDALAQLLLGSKVNSAYTGLMQDNRSIYYSTNGDSLDCTTYRAWAPGHPKKNSNNTYCVLLTNQRTWKTTLCNKRHPALCELIPGGPYKRGSIYGTASRKNDTEARK